MCLLSTISMMITAVAIIDDSMTCDHTEVDQWKAGGRTRYQGCLI